MADIIILKSPILVHIIFYYTIGAAAAAIVVTTMTTTTITSSQSTTGPHVHPDEKADRQSSLLGTGKAASVPSSRHRPKHAHAPAVRLPKRGQVKLHEQSHASRR